MKLFAQLLTLGLVGQGVVASNWFSKSIYNKWHETELERWLSDHDIPHPSPADRADLEKLVQENWNSKIVSPYSDWDTTQLKAYLSERSQEAADAAGASKDSLLETVRSYWYETEDKAEDAFSSVKDWIFDSWSDSQLKVFADKHGIPVPQPRKRDQLLQKIRYDYDTVAKKAGESISYPGNWLYETWTESDLKEWLDTHGIPAPQPQTRDKLIASVRRNSRLATLKAQSSMTEAQKQAQKAADSISDSIIANWDDSKIKEWADKNGVKVPQGSKHAELLAILRKHRAKLLDDTLSATAASGYGAATSKANNQWARATDDAQLKAQEAFDAAIAGWSETRLKARCCLKAYLDARGVPVPQNGRKDDLVAAVRKHSHKASTGNNAWTYDTWTYDNLKKWLSSTGDKQAKKAANKAGATRDDLVAAAQAYYSSASAASGASFATVTSYLAAATDSAKTSTFDTWSDSELKAYLDTFGVPVPQGSTTNELRAWARNQANWFRHGTTTPQGTLLAKLKETFDWAYNQVVVGVQNGINAAQYEGTKGQNRAKEAGTYAKDRAYEEKEKAKHRADDDVSLNLKTVVAASTTTNVDLTIGLTQSANLRTRRWNKLPTYAPPRTTTFVMEPPAKPQSALFQVYLRLRPPPVPNSLYPTLTTQERFVTVEESDEGAPTHITLNPPNDNRRRAVEKFAFTEVFEEEASQLDIFHGTGVIPLVEGVLAANGGDGRDGLLATLGVTGSGKSHTILGSRSQRGLTQLALDLLFRSISNNILDPNTTYSLHNSVAASDPSEAQVLSSQGFLDIIYGDQSGASRATSRAATPMRVHTPFHIPGSFPRASHSPVPEKSFYPILPRLSSRAGSPQSQGLARALTQPEPHRAQ
ncbi:hypothetical protein V495_06555, partial [Pseudogymnoascus sp. VKM F-4514 (FW-929)]